MREMGSDVDRAINSTCNALALEVKQEIANDVARRWRESVASLRAIEQRARAELDACESKMQGDPWTGYAAAIAALRRVLGEDATSTEAMGDGRE